MKLRFNRCGAHCVGQHFESKTPASTPAIPGQPAVVGWPDQTFTFGPLNVGWWRFAIVSTGSFNFDYEEPPKWYASEITNPPYQEAIREPIHGPTSKLYLRKDGSNYKTLSLTWFDYHRTFPMWPYGGEVGPGSYYAFGYVDRDGTEFRAEYDKFANPTHRVFYTPAWASRGPGTSFYEQNGSLFNSFYIVGDLISGCDSNNPIFGHGSYPPEFYNYPWNIP